jgi:hypothetical protein
VCVCVWTLTLSHPIRRMPPHALLSLRTRVLLVLRSKVQHISQQQILSTSRVLQQVSGPKSLREECSLTVAATSNSTSLWWGPGPVRWATKAVVATTGSQRVAAVCSVCNVANVGPLPPVVGIVGVGCAGAVALAGVALCAVPIILPVKVVQKFSERRRRERSSPRAVQRAL